MSLFLFLEVTTVRSNNVLLPNDWSVISVSKNLKEVKVIVNGDTAVEKPTGHKSLHLLTPLYVGGYDKNRIKLNQNTGVSTGFDGCISEVTILKLLLYFA